MSPVLKLILTFLADGAATTAEIKLKLVSALPKPVSDSNIRAALAKALKRNYVQTSDYRALGLPDGSRNLYALTDVGRNILLSIDGTLVPEQVRTYLPRETKVAHELLVVQSIRTLKGWCQREGVTLYYIDEWEFSRDSIGSHKAQNTGYQPDL